MILCDTDIKCIRGFSQLNKENAELFAKMHNTNIFTNKNEKTGDIYCPGLCDDTIMVVYPKENELYLTIYRYWELEREFHITKAPIDSISDTYISFHGGTLEYGQNGVLKENLNEVVECDKWHEKKLNIFMLEENEELAIQLIKEYYQSKQLVVLEQIEYLKKEQQRYLEVVENELKLINYN